MLSASIGNRGNSQLMVRRSVAGDAVCCSRRALSAPVRRWFYGATLSRCILPACCRRSRCRCESRLSPFGDISAVNGAGDRRIALSLFNLNVWCVAAAQWRQALWQRISIISLRCCSNLLPMTGGIAARWRRAPGLVGVLFQRNCCATVGGNRRPSGRHRPALSWG